MKTSIKNLLLLLLLLGLPAVVQAQDAYSTNADGSIYTYSTNADGSANIVAYAGPPWVVTIPTNINGLTVTSIGDDAFAYTSLTSVTIPGSVTSIGVQAFYSTSLTNATIGNGVTNIGADAFGGASFTSVTIPNSVTSIGDRAFSPCESLTSITVDASNSAYSSMNGVLFDKAQATLLQFPGGLGGSYTIPGSVTSIGLQAFADCFSLTNATIGNSVTSIGDAAFSGCSSLRSVTIPNTVTVIGIQLFGNCFSLTSVTIPNSVTNIGAGAFGEDDSLTSVYFTGNAPSPSNDSSVFLGDPDPVTVYYLPGTTGWGATFDGRPTAPWFLPNPQILIHSAGFGVQPGGFGFTISWATNVSVVVEAATNLANPVWIPVSTNTLTGGTNYFSDPQWTNYPGRFYRAASAFTVGGTLTGLPYGETVTVQDSGSDNLMLSANGTFTFPTALPNGHAYSVTFSGMSGINPIACTITNGSGTISGANVTNVLVQCTFTGECPKFTGSPDVDMYEAASSDGTSHGGVPAVMVTEFGGPFRVTALGPCSDNVAFVNPGWAVFTQVVGNESCTSTTFPSGTWVIQFGNSVACGYGPYGY